MDEASRRVATSRIREAQRCVGNLHSFTANYLNSKRLEVNGKPITLPEFNVQLDQQIQHIQAELEEAASELRK